MEDNNERLLAFCSITFDDAFVIRDLKIIEGAKGSFVAMPSRKLTDRCPQCGCKNHLRARHCNQCGHKLDEDRATRDADGRAKLHADIAHPVNSALGFFRSNLIHQKPGSLAEPGFFFALWARHPARWALAGWARHSCLAPDKSVWPIPQVATQVIWLSFGCEVGTGCNFPLSLSRDGTPARLYL